MLEVLIMKKQQIRLPDSITDALANAVAAGQHDEILRFEAGSSPKSDGKKLHRILNAHQDLYLENGIVYKTSGIAFAGVAQWRSALSVKVNDHEHRFRILSLDRFGKTSIFAIPVKLLGLVKELPGIDLSKAELEFIFQVADSLRDLESDQEIFVPVRHPAQQTVRENVFDWRWESFEQASLLQILEEEPTILHIAAAAMDSQLRVFKQCKWAPQGIYNFIPQKGNVQTYDWFMDVCSIFTFSSETSAFASGPVEIAVKDVADLEKWRGCFERFVIIKTATGSLVWSIAEELKERERIIKCGGQLPPQLPTLPVVSSHGILNIPEAVDIELPKSARLLSDAAAGMLRAAMKHLLNDEIIRTTYSTWKSRRGRISAYRENGFTIWRQLLEEKAIDMWFKNPELHQKAEELLHESELAQQKAEAMRTETIQKAIDLLSSPTRFEREIIERPTTKKDAIEHLNRLQDAVAFWYTPSKGNDEGKCFLAFSKDSLLRLLQRIGFNENLYDTLIVQSEKAGLLNQQNRSIKLGDNTFNAVTFCVEK